jgi:hypothetical protein
VIAYPTKNGQRLSSTYEETKDDEERRQNLFDIQMEKILPEVEHNLRKKRFLLIDAKSAKNIRNKQVSFKVFDETNCINEYSERDTPFNSDRMNLMTPELNDDLWMDKLNFI